MKSLGVHGSVGTSFHEPTPRLGREPERVMHDELQSHNV